MQLKPISQGGSHASGSSFAARVALKSGQRPATVPEPSVPSAFVRELPKELLDIGSFHFALSASERQNRSMDQELLLDEIL